MAGANRNRSVANLRCSYIIAHIIIVQLNIASAFNQLRWRLHMRNIFQYIITTNVTLNFNILSIMSPFVPRYIHYIILDGCGANLAILNLYRIEYNTHLTVYPRFCRRRRGLLKGTLQCLTKLCKYKRISCRSGHKRSTIRPRARSQLHPWLANILTGLEHTYAG